MGKHLSRSAEETLLLGLQFGVSLVSGNIVCFSGELAAGKTTFIKGLVAGAADYPQEKVNSPTFVYLNIYRGKQTIFHFDLYRLRDQDEFLAMGFDDFLYADGICCIEWSERIDSLLPPHVIRVTMNHVDANARQITIGSIP